MTHWKNLKALTTAPELENNILRSSSTTDGLQTQRREQRSGSHCGLLDAAGRFGLVSNTYGMLERCKVAEGGKMLE